MTAAFRALRKSWPFSPQHLPQKMQPNTSGRLQVWELCPAFNQEGLDATENRAPIVKGLLKQTISEISFNGYTDIDLSEI